MARFSDRSIMSRLGRPLAGWTNWAGNQHSNPARIERPLTEAQVQQVVRSARDAGRRVRTVGAGHSFNDIVCTDDVLVSLDHLNLVRAIDHSTGTVTVDAGIELNQLNVRLRRVGLAMTNLGDIAYQSVAGAISTSTHGTGLRFGGLATHVLELRLVTATGDVVECGPDNNPELFDAARVGLGALGIITRVTIKVEPAFNLHAIEGPRPIAEVLDSWTHDIATHDHYEFFWIPGTSQAMTKVNRRTDDPIDPLPKVTYVRDKVLGENIGFGAMVKAAALRPSLVPKMRSLIVESVGQSEYTDISYKVFASPRWVKFVEMEYSVAVADLPEVVGLVDDAVRSAGLELMFPIEARVAQADHIPLSTAHGRDSAYLAVHRAKGLPYQEYFEMVEAIMDDFGGRPHWGKMHFHTATTLAPRYPEWDRWQAVRRQQDPTGLFANDHTDRVLGAGQ